MDPSPGADLMTNAENPPALSDLEREVMEQVWSASEEVSVRDVLNGINEANEKQRAYTTLMTILSRLEAKGMVTKRRKSKSDLFTPVLSRSDYLESRAKVEVDALVGEYGEIARALFVREIEDTDPDAAKKLKKLIDKS